MRRKHPVPSSSPHSAQAESRTIQNTTISSRFEIVPTLGTALTDVEFSSIAKDGGLTTSAHQWPFTIVRPSGAAHARPRHGRGVMPRRDRCTSMSLPSPEYSTSTIESSFLNLKIDNWPPANVLMIGLPPKRRSICPRVMRVGLSPDVRWSRSPPRYVHWTSHTVLSAAKA